MSHPRLIEEVLVETNRTFLVAFNLLRRRSRDDQTAWMRQRRAALNGLRHAAVAAFSERMAVHADALMTSWRSGNHRLVLADMERLTSAVVADYCVGEEGRRLPQLARALLDALFPVVSSPLRVPHRLPTPAKLRIRWALIRLQRELHRLIAARRSGPSTTNDLLGALLAAPSLTDVEIAETLVSVLLASHGVPAAALAWIWYLLAWHPEAEKRLHEEVDRSATARLSDRDALAHLPYTTSVVKEALRLYPPTWLAVRRVASECELGGYPLRPGQAVMFSSYVVQRDPRWHPRADRFTPERWLDSTTIDLPRGAYFPFGSGPRHCPGSGLALSELVLAIAAIAQRFRLCLPAGVRVRADARRTLVPHNLIMKVQPR